MQRVALITGSTSGIGLSVASAFASKGVSVMLNGFGSEAEINAAVDQCKKAATGDATVNFAPADLSKAADARELITTTVNKFGRLDILVNNAGIQHVAPIDDYPEETWDKVIAVNLSSVFHLTKAALPIMKENGFGRIVNVASVHGLVASANKAPYVAAKHGVIGLTKTTALENARTNITCNAVCPGWVLTPLVEKQIEARAAEKNISFDAAKTELVGEKMPSAEPAAPEEIAEACWYFANPISRSSNGSILTVDGGWTSQ